MKMVNGYLQKAKASSKAGFTLIELLVVIGILAILLAITLIAINPAKQFASANDTKRSSDVNAILNAVGQYMADHRGSLTAITTLTSTPTEIGNTTGASPALVDLCATLVPTYLAALPADPLSTRASPAGSAPCTGAQYHTGYVASVNASGRVTISATPETVGTSISVTR